MSGYEVCADIGGTFTDVYARTPDGTTRSAKAPTTPAALTEGLFDALAGVADGFDESVESLLGGTSRFIHGTTIATNAIIEGDLPKTALVCTEGFRDTLVLREGGKDNPYDWTMDYPEPFVPRRLTFGVPERVTSDGSVRTPLDEQACRRVIGELVDRGVEAVAVALLWAHQNPVHEEWIGELLDEEAPGIEYALSSAVCPIIREYRRASATAITASLFGVVSDYLGALEDQLRGRGFDGTPLVITANGGVMQVDEVARSPIWLVDAGPTVFPVAARRLVRAELGVEDVVALDMGGTSLDMGVVRDGFIPRSREATVGDDHMLGVEKVEITSIGAGGGSIARVDAAGLVHVGPESAGADPGPACYGRGGERPTVTDAALVLGYLDPAYFLGGRMEIQPDRAAGAVREHVADPLEVGLAEAARAVYGAAVQNIANGVKGVTIERGIDPRAFVLSGGGGALGLFAVAVARELGIDAVVLPREAGVVSAMGGLVAGVRRDFSESVFTTSEAFDHEDVVGVLESLGGRAAEFFDRAGISAAERSVAYFVEARYPSQVWELDVPVPDGFAGLGAEEGVGRLVAGFHGVHEETYGFSISDQPVEFLQWRVEAAGPTPEWVPSGRVELGTGESAGMKEEAGEEVVGSRAAVFGGERVETPAYRAGGLRPGGGFDGPGIVDAPTTTVVVPPGARLQVTEHGHYHLTP